ncbi:SLATT domain-containing protein [Algoriphagus halophytocola]|uniref:SLATT domain-containing protein n=1 Tax=Algoriphagus halophytocola TaxID=2991499 RepID=UPI0022DDD2EB|nr:SLATT domain-containing protein [Algoriphagus sp. TR-M9]WBL43553.1 SLATT domain-containing protein [Algoriphagus sp. TR-M9]
MKENQKSYKDYLDKTFLEELNYKIWSTKGARFKANERLIHIAQLSNICTSMLSIYLIAVGLLSVYNLNSALEYDYNLLAYSSTCLSILVLVFGQIENAKDFKLKANQFHNCGLELSHIYNELRIFKTLTLEPNLKDKGDFSRKISDEYQKILERYENHDSIDHQRFIAAKPKYHELNWFDVFFINISYYFKTSFIYHLMIIIPPFIILILIIK